MAYKRSTQATGFRQRTAPDVSKEINSQAKQMDANRIAAVKDMERQSKAQVVEMQRQDTLATTKDKYELGNLAKFSKTLNTFLQESGKTFGKAYVEKKQLEGVDLRRKVRAGDEKATAKVELNEQQLDEIEKKIAEQKTKTQEAGDKFDAVSARATLEDKYRALNLRKLGHNVAYGYTKASLGEARKGWQPWFLNQTKDGGEYSDDTIPFELPTGENIELRIGDYEDLVETDKKKAIEDYLVDRYVVNNSQGASPSVVDRYLTKNVYDDLDKYRVKQLGLEIKELATKEITDREHNIFTEVDGSAFDEAKTGAFDTGIEDVLNNGSSSQRRSGSSDAPNVANRKNLKKIIETSFSIADPEKGADLLDHLQDKTYCIKGLGCKKLEEHFPDVDLADLYAQAKVNAVKNKQNLLKAKKFELNAKIDELQTTFRNGGTQADFDAGLAELNTDYYNSMGNDFDLIIKDAREWKPEFMTVEAAEKDALLRIEQNQEITLEQAQRYPLSVREKFKDQIVDKSIFSEGAAKTKYLGNSTDLQSYLTKDIYGAVSTTDTSSYTLDNAKDYVAQAIRLEAIKLRNVPGNEGLNELELLEQATANIKTQMDEGKDIPGNLWHVETGKGFTHPKFNHDRYSDYNVNTVLAQSKATVTNALQLQNASTQDVFTEKLLLTNDKDFELSDNVPTKTIQRLAAVDPYGRSSYEILNAQRKLKGLDPVPVPEGEQTIHGLATKFNAVDDLKSGDPKRIARGLNRMGMTDLRTLHSALRDSNIPIVSAEQLPDILKELNISKADYENNPQLKQKVERHRINELLKVAATQTNDNATMIRMVATGITQGEDQMTTWNEPQNAGSLDVLNTYFTGDTSNITGSYSDVYAGAVLAGEKDGSIISAVINTPITSNPQKLTYLSERLKLAEPPKRLKTMTGVGIIYRTNPEYIQWRDKVEEVDNMQTSLTALNKTYKGRWNPTGKDIKAISALVSGPGKVGPYTTWGGIVRDSENYVKSLPNFKKMSTKEIVAAKYEYQRNTLKNLKIFGGEN